MCCLSYHAVTFYDGNKCCIIFQSCYTVPKSWMLTIRMKMGELILLLIKSAKLFYFISLFVVSFRTLVSCRRISPVWLITVYHRAVHFIWCNACANTAIRCVVLNKTLYKSLNIDATLHLKRNFGSCWWIGVSPYCLLNLFTLAILWQVLQKIMNSYFYCFSLHNLLWLIVSI